MQVKEKKRKEGKKRPSQRLTLFPFTPSSSSSTFGRQDLSGVPQSVFGKDITFR
jgi:hypothetical protein